ncbi:MULTISPECIES: D-arabinono-1,4-lactone oxidase [unclassified Ruegeria]|uniref:D-arabinono-1,4-lactone oxidase n=1 Tax=unclassified Ruegeria TaxID=2625375 RepID=UPI001489FE82|nr:MULTISPECIES: D-arabinono-1,4-lactone oxidase [unclassified Ruegeria]NOD74705.1 FAD-binding protein [Ruegeria sp. HKCCD4332]
MWSNWAGNENTNTAVMRPTTLDALQRAVMSPQTLRVVGAGHSFTPIVAGAERILDLSQLEAPTIGAAEDGQVWVNANARLRDLSPALADRGLAFRNLGDINTQSLAGAVSTATHGTGRELPCLAAEITDARFVGASGEALTSADIPLDMAQVTLGLLGVLTEARINVVPKYNLRRQVTLTDLPECLANMHRNWAENRNFEFFYIPFTGKAVELRHSVVDAPETKAPRDLDMLAVKVLKLARNAGRFSGGLRSALLRLLTMAQSDEDYVGESWRVLCSDRHIRFKEMEYHLPPEVASDVLAEVFRRLERDHRDIYFPIEVRQTAGDTACLSPFQSGPRISVAIHTDADEDHSRYFNALEPLFVEAGGRPHWGKMHSLTYRELSGLYPDFDRFCALREQLDPQGKFLTPALATLFQP